MKRAILLTCIILVSAILFAQPSHSIKGIIINKSKREPVAFSNIQIIGSAKGCISDSTGNFVLSNVQPGIYCFQVSAIGYKTLISPEYILSTKNLVLTFELEENITQLNEVNITTSIFRRVTDTPIGLRLIGLQEIEKSPAANRDISRIVRNYAGVSYSPASYRNDLIVRGGSPSENKFYLDGVEIPNINHFSTQGASGGPVGILNADLIREVGFYTSSFPVNKGNALSSVLDFKLRDGSTEKNSLKFTLGASEISLSSNGPLTNNTTYLVSVRQSYLQFLFNLIGLPFLPTYTDAQFKLKTKINKHNEISILGLGGIDRMKLNKNATGELNKYILNSLPTISQDTYTYGVVYKHYSDIHQQTITLSKSYLNNRFIKYLNNDESSDENISFNYKSQEKESKLRFENNSIFSFAKMAVGANIDYSHYSNTTFQKTFTSKPLTNHYDTSLDILRWGLFATINYESPNERFIASLGIRTDASNYSSSTSNLNNQLSPRLSLSYQLFNGAYISTSLGRYFQLPPFTALGYKDNMGRYINKGLQFMKVDQKCIGITYQANNNLQLSSEIFYKQYDNLPLSVNDQIPLQDKGVDYGVVGNEELTSTAQGKSYGIEFMAKWIIPKKLNMSSALTIYRSMYRKNPHDTYANSSWDNQYIFNLSGTYYLPRMWSLGIKTSSIGGSPYTPFDVDKSSLVDAWDAQGKPYLDYTKYNTLRLPSYTQIDLRVDKTFYIKAYMLGFYLDIQNIGSLKQKQQDIIISTGEVINTSAPKVEHRYKMKTIEQISGTLIPTIGITFEF